MVFAKVINGVDLSSQGHIASQFADLAATGGVRPIMTTRLDGFTAQNMKSAHQMLESRRTTGKIVIIL